MIWLFFDSESIVKLASKAVEIELMGCSAVNFNLNTCY